MNPKLRLGSAVAIVLLSVSAGPVWTEPIGPSFQINTEIDGDQVEPSVSAAPDGQFVVTWEHRNRRLRGQRFGAAGGSVGGELKVQEPETNFYPVHSGSQVAMNSQGGFVVSWRTYETSQPDRYLARFFDVGGSVLGLAELEEQFFADAAGGEISAATATAQNGEFVALTTISYCIDTVPCTPYARLKFKRFTASGELVTSSTLSSEYPKRMAKIAGAQVGHGPSAPYEFVVSWAGEPGFTDRVFDKVGAAAETVPVNYRANPALAGNGNTFSSWSDDSVWGRLYDHRLVPLTDDLLIAEVGADAQVAASDNGSFLVIWHDSGEISGQEIDSRGNLVGGHFLISEATVAYSRNARVAALDAGRFVVVWTANLNAYGGPGDDLDGTSIRGRLTRSATIFGDGFESGDATAWSGSRIGAARGWLPAR